jgi:hypothetical protein
MHGLIPKVSSPVDTFFTFFSTIGKCRSTNHNSHKACFLRHLFFFTKLLQPCRDPWWPNILGANFKVASRLSPRQLSQTMMPSSSRKRRRSVLGDFFRNNRLAGGMRMLRFTRKNTEQLGLVFMDLPFGTKFVSVIHNSAAITGKHFAVVVLAH